MNLFLWINQADKITTPTFLSNWNSKAGWKVGEGFDWNIKLEMWPIIDFYVNIKLDSNSPTWKLLLKIKLNLEKLPTNFQFLLLLSILAQRCFAVRNQKVWEYPSSWVSWFAVSKLIFLVFCFYKMSLIIAKFVRLLIFSCLRANSSFYTDKIPVGRCLFNHKNSSRLLFSVCFFGFLIEPTNNQITFTVEWFVISLSQSSALRRSPVSSTQSGRLGEF